MERNGIWKFAAVFMAGVFVSGGTAWMTLQKDSITAEQLKEGSPWAKDKGEVLLKIKHNAEDITEIKSNLKAIRSITTDNNRLIIVVNEKLTEGQDGP